MTSVWGVDEVVFALEDSNRPFQPGVLPRNCSRFHAPRCSQPLQEAQPRSPQKNTLRPFVLRPSSSSSSTSSSSAYMSAGSRRVARVVRRWPWMRRHSCWTGLCQSCPLHSPSSTRVALLPDSLLEADSGRARVLPCPAQLQLGFHAQSLPPNPQRCHHYYSDVKFLRYAR